MKNATALRPSVLDALHHQLRGVTVFEGEAYASGRKMWNAAIDRFPAAIVVCADAEDVAYAVRIAADNGLPVTVRAGGHNVAGRSIRDGALLLDLSRLRGVKINPKSRVAAVQGGAVWRDLDVAAAAEELATTGGLVSTTGVAGLTLGGGTGWLMRKHGLASDNLLSAGIVLGDGRFVRTSAEEHGDLFWGLRGGAGGLGVVINLEYRLHPLRDVLAGLLVYPADQARDVLREFRDFATAAPDEFCGQAVIIHAPALPFLDSAWHGRPVTILAVCWAGDLAIGERALAPLRSRGQSLVEHISVMPYAHWQQLLDPLAPPGRHHYWKTASYASLSDATIDRLAAAARRLPSALSEIHVQHLGGAVARVPAAESAFAHRNAAFFVNLLGIESTVEKFAATRDAIRALHNSLASEALSGSLPNFGGQDDSDAIRWFGAENAQRIEILRRRCDPAGVLAGE